MADTDELYAKAKSADALKTLTLVAAVLIRRARHFRASKRSPKRWAYGPLATFYRRYSRSFYRSFGLRICSKFYAKPTEISSKNAQNFVSSKLAAELGELENERVNLVAAIKKANLIGIGVGVCAGAAITYLLDAIFGMTPSVLAYTFTTMFITASKRREFRANFKRQIIENIVKKHALSYDKDRGLGV